MPRPDAITPVMSPDQSRRASILVVRDDDARLESKESRDARLRLEREKAAVRAENLKRSLAELNGFSTDMTKRLDDTYYSVLEKMSTLQNTVTALKDLAESSREICEGFDKDSRELADEIVGQLVAVGHFDEQQTRIAGLQNRIHDGRAKVQTLTSRVDAVRERIESWERADRAWQERTRKRLKIIWSVTSVVTILIIALAVGVHYTSYGLDSDGQDELRNTAAPEWLSESNFSRQSTDRADVGGRALFWKTPLRDGERLRAFDEL
ncbi:CAMK protein kinase [Purpureocillium lavendulum]|uniref:CAMK protein kinase n=1 Tax=Purpureocillium lavendulum TaxID=1247861 RepID=A0AB34G477_9HYPO|nr:CAMK protein kinase [Purpureocillium lavendulum]